MRSSTAFTITANITRASGAPMQRCGPSPNATWRLGARSSTTWSARSNSCSSWLSANDSVATDRAAERLVDRAVPEVLVGRGAVQLRVVDELLPQLRMGAEMQ